MSPAADRVYLGMTRIIADITVSLDGFVTGPDPGPANGLGTGGEALHTWAFSDDPEDRRVLREATARSGAVVLGRRLFDVVDGPEGWNDESGYGASEVGKPAFVVVTSSPPESLRLTDLDWTFVTTGLPDAVGAARERAEAASSRRGEDLNVVLMGGGATAGSALSARRRAGRRADAAPRARRAGRRDAAVHRRSATHAGAAEGDLDLDRGAPDLRRRLTMGRPWTLQPLLTNDSWTSAKAR